MNMQVENNNMMSDMTLTSSNINGSANVNSKLYNIDKLPPFKLSLKDVESDIAFQGDRVYIDEFKDVGDGRLYKG
jgi:hypothetical protein